jgi:hypothetical protein
LTQTDVSAFIGATVKHLLKYTLALVVALLAGSLACAAPVVAPKPAKDQLSIDFSGSVAVVDLKDLLTPYNAPAGREGDDSR